METNNPHNPLLESSTPPPLILTTTSEDTPHLYPAPPSNTDHWLSEGLRHYEVRRALAQTFDGFCYVYLPHYLKLDPAEFFRYMLDQMADPAISRLLIAGFRGSAKSTYGSLALPVWAAVVKPDTYPFILPIADTGMQAGINIANIKNELEYNELLLQDFGKIPFATTKDPNPEPSLESDEEWQAKNMLLNNGVRILARSRGQKVRGLRHREHRPSLAVVDDPEALAWVKTKENRDSTEQWLRGELMGAMDQERGRIVMLSNFLHNDAIVARAIKWDIFKVLEFPLIAPDGHCTWPAMYPTQEKLDAKRKELGEVAWQREMMLKVVPEEGQEVTEDDIHYYDSEPAEGLGLIGHGVDLAISKKSTADYTAIITGNARHIDGRPKIYVQKSPINAHMDFHSTKELIKSVPNIGGYHLFFVEAVSFQKAAIEELERAQVPVIGVQPIADKRARLRVAATYIKNGTVLFPRDGLTVRCPHCEALGKDPNVNLLTQLMGFGVEAHDDMVDALVYLILGLVNQGLELPVVRWING